MLRILTIAIAILIAIGFGDPILYIPQSSPKEMNFSVTCSRASLLPPGLVPTSPLPRHCQIEEDGEPMPIAEPTSWE
jgi:hypothetical protein